MGNGSSLRVVQLSGNRLSGSFPEELLQIHNLLSLDVSRNSMYGDLPSFEDCAYLQKLLLHNNLFTGVLPTFTENWRLSTIDLSQNAFDKPIPDNFLDGT